MDVRDVLGINDALIEFEITSNRPDCRSIIGIAREAAVTLGKELKYPEIKKQLWGGHLWNPSYFVATVSDRTLEQIEHYINNQKTK